MCLFFTATFFFRTSLGKIDRLWDFLKLVIGHFYHITVEAGYITAPHGITWPFPTYPRVPRHAIPSTIIFSPHVAQHLVRLLIGSTRTNPKGIVRTEKGGAIVYDGYRRMLTNGTLMFSLSSSLRRAQPSCDTHTALGVIYVYDSIGYPYFQRDVCDTGRNVQSFSSALVLCCKAIFLKFLLSSELNLITIEKKLFIINLFNYVHI